MSIVKKEEAKHQRKEVSVTVTKKASNNVLSP